VSERLREHFALPDGAALAVGARRFEPGDVIELPPPPEPEPEPNAIVCTRCGVANHPGIQFCVSCSAFLEWSGRAVIAPVHRHSDTEAGMEPTGEDPPGLRQRVHDWVVYGEHAPAPAPVPRVSYQPVMKDEMAAPLEPTVVLPAVRPDAPVVPRLARKSVNEDAAVAEEVFCVVCGTGNPSARRYCRRCGQDMTPPPVPVRLTRAQRRVQRKEDQRLAQTLLPLGSRPKVKRQAVGGVGSGWLTSAVARAFGAVALVAVALSMFGPWAPTIRSHVSGWATDIRRTVHPTYVAIYANGADASSAAPGHPAIDAIDNNTSTYWQADSTNPLGQTLAIRFPQQEKIDRIGFLIGVQNPPQNYLNSPRPELVHLVFSDGTSADLNLQDTASFQAFPVSARAADQLQVTVESFFASAADQHVAITEIEFFRKQ